MTFRLALGLPHLLFDGYWWHVSQGIKLTTHPQLVLGLWMSGAIPVLPLYVFMALSTITLPLPVRYTFGRTVWAWNAYMWNLIICRWCVSYVTKLPCLSSRWWCTTNRKVAGSIPAGVIGIFHWHKILPIALWLWGRLSL